MHESVAKIKSLIRASLFIQDIQSNKLLPCHLRPAVCSKPKNEVGCDVAAAVAAIEEKENREKL